MSRMFQPRHAPLSAEELTRRATALTVVESKRQSECTSPSAPDKSPADGPGESAQVAEFAGAPADPGAARHGGSGTPQVSGVTAGETATLSLHEFAPVDTWVATSRGLERWRPIVDDVTVTALPRGARRLEFHGYVLKLDAELSAHLGLLLLPPDIAASVRRMMAEGGI